MPHYNAIYKPYFLSHYGTRRVAAYNTKER